MARTWTYGDDLPAVALDRSGNAMGGIALTVWTAKTGGTQVTDLEVLNAAGEWIDSTVVVTWSTGKQGSFAFRSNTGPEVWIQDPAGYRYHVTAHENLASAVAATASSAQAAAASATAAGTAKTAAETASSTATTAAGTATSARDAAVTARAGAEAARDTAQQLVGTDTGWINVSPASGFTATQLQYRRVWGQVFIRASGIARTGGWVVGPQVVATIPVAPTAAAPLPAWGADAFRAQVTPQGQLSIYAPAASTNAAGLGGGYLTT